MNTNLNNYVDNTSAGKQSGVGIIEVLIALVVVSLGVLGMASLQLTGMKHSSSGYNRSMAVLFAENMASRMRSNAAGVIDTNYAGLDSSDLNCTAKPAPFCQATVNSAAQTCTPAEMAVFDFYSIACGTITADGTPKDGIADLLNGGRLQVECDESPCEDNSGYKITINWTEGRTTTEVEDVDTKRVQVRFNP